MSRLIGYPSHLGSCRSLLKHSSNMLLTIQPIFMSRHEISVATSTGAFSLYFIRKTNSLVETLSVHLATIPRRDINYLLRPELSSFGVETYRTVSQQDLSLKLFLYLINFSLVATAFIWPRILSCCDLDSLSPKVFVSTLNDISISSSCCNLKFLCRDLVSS